MNEKDEIKELKKEIKHIKDWLQVWVINERAGEDWRKLMEKELNKGEEK